ncbi:glycoside hydrolase [Podospora australis]|uniref:Mannan endo-1,6-alpha-mannosidase n=1 Tax=Podospora australis TaxID=1536484 RepID=A0AAN6WLI3_9PEZI|nr:glycoside hydrolase [Podospora australis]
MRAFSIPLLAAGIGSVSAALQVDFSSTSSIKTAAKNLASDAVGQYNGTKPGEIPGILGNPMVSGYWTWTGSVFLSTLMDHWRYTGDDQYNDLIAQGLLHQKGPNNDFLAPNWTATLGEDDHGFWGMAAMLAAELDLPNSNDNLSWVDYAVNVFRSKEQRWDDFTCDGGFRWQIPPTNMGYDYKNALSTAVYINLGGRLARFTGNETYGEIAERSWDWLTEVGYIDAKNNVYDGAHVQKNCTDINRVQFSYTPAVLLEGAAHLYNSTTGEEQTRWRDRLIAMTNRTLDVFLQKGVHIEVACELRSTCTPDMVFFKGIFLRAFANVAQLAPFLHDDLTEAFKTNAEAAVKTCTGGDNGRRCGFTWAEEGDDGEGKIPGTLNALSALDVLLIDEVSQKSLSTAPGGSGSGSGSEGGNGNNNGAGNSAQEKPAGSGGSATRVTAAMLFVGLFAAFI